MREDAVEEKELFTNQTRRIHARLVGLQGAAREADRDAMFLLLENRSYGYPGTTGTLWSNFLAYCLNRHPLISIVCAHPLHPFTRPERAVILLCSFCFVRPSRLEPERGAGGRGRGSPCCALPAAAHRAQAFFLSTFMKFPSVRAQPLLVRYTILAALVIPYEIFIRVIAVCACVQYDDSERGERKRRFVQRSGHCTLFIIMMLNVVWVLFGILELIGAPVWGMSRIELGLTTVAIRAWSLVLWAGQWTPVFLLFYNHDKELWLRKHPPGSPQHVCAVTSRDADANFLYWLLLTGSRSPPPPRDPYGPSWLGQVPFRRGPVPFLPRLRVRETPREPELGADDAHEGATRELSAVVVRGGDEGGGHHGGFVHGRHAAPGEASAAPAYALPYDHPLEGSSSGAALAPGSRPAAGEGERRTSTFARPIAGRSALGVQRHTELRSDSPPAPARHPVTDVGDEAKAGSAVQGAEAVAVANVLRHLGVGTRRSNVRSSLVAYERDQARLDAARLENGSAPSLAQGMRPLPFVGDNAERTPLTPPAVSRSVSSPCESDELGARDLGALQGSGRCLAGSATPSSSAWSSSPRHAGPGRKHARWRQSTGEAGDSRPDRGAASSASSCSHAGHRVLEDMLRRAHAPRGMMRHPSLDALMTDDAKGQAEAQTSAIDGADDANVTGPAVESTTPSTDARWTPRSETQTAEGESHVEPGLATAHGKGT